MKLKVRKLLRNICFSFLVLFCGLIIITCSSEDDAALKDGKVAASLSEADQLEAPYISTLTINDSSAATNQTGVSVKLSGKDAVGITGYIISNQSTAPDLNSSSWVDITSQTQYSVTKDSTVGPSDASYSFYGWMRDAANNISATSSSSIVYDTTAPTISSVSINSGDSSTTNNIVVSLSISASDGLSGIAAYYASETSTDPSATATGWVSITTTNSLSSTVSFTLTSPGQLGTFTKTVYLWVKDSAGNVSDSASDSIQLIITDQSPPTNPSISINSGASTVAIPSVTLSLSATDDIGVTGYYLSQTSSTPSSSASGWTSVTSATSYSGSVSYTLSGGNGTNTVYVWFKDGAGNVSSSASDSINLQDDPPSNPSISINSGVNSTFSPTVTLTLTASDDVGVTGYYLSQTSSTPSSSASGWTSVTSATSYSGSVSYTLSGGSGTKTVYVWFKDSGGNVSSSASDSITYYLIPNIYCGNTNTNLGGDTAFTATKITNNSTYSFNLSSGEHAYYFFTASSDYSYTVAYSSNSNKVGQGYTIYTGVGNYAASAAFSSIKNGLASISSYTGNVIILLSSSSPDDPTITFQVTGTIINAFSSKNSYCQQSITKGNSAYGATNVDLDKIYRISLSSTEDAYFSFSANSSKSYNISYASTRPVWLLVYKGVGNNADSSGYSFSYSTSISSFSGTVIILFKHADLDSTTDFRVTQE